MMKLIASVYVAIAITAGPSAVAQGPPQKGPQDLTSIQHFVFIIKENRTFDNMFGTYPGAIGATTGAISTGEVIPLGHAPDVYPRDIGHGWQHTPLVEDHGRMDKFDLIQKNISKPCNINGDFLCYTQLYQSDIPNYFAYANNFVLADQTFSSMSGASFPNHLYTVAADSNRVIGNPNSTYYWGCDAPPDVTAPALDAEGFLVDLYPCFDFPTLTDLLDSAGVSWKYYAPGQGQNGYQWSALNAINHIRNTSLWTQNVLDTSQFIADASSGNLPAVSWIVPPGPESEHLPHSSCEGENWTVQQVNAVMQGPNWNSTAIVIVWDDFGGLYDHAYPPQLDIFGLGLRVPLLIISPYAKKGYISHTVYEFSSMLKLVEERFILAPLTLRDANANDMLDSFDFTEVRPPVVLPTRHCPVLSTQDLNFAPQAVGTTSSGRTITVSNFGASTLNISSATISGDFKLLNGCGSGVKPGKVCYMTVSYAPTATGMCTGTLIVTDSDETSPQSVLLHGMGTNITLSPSLLRFPNAIPGKFGATMTSTLTNKSSSSLSISGVTVSGDYKQTNTCGIGIQAGGACVLTVTFKPSVAGKRFGTVTIQDSDGGSPHVLRMTGLGTALTVSKAKLTFPDTKIGFASPPSSVTITNKGSSTLNLTNIAIQDLLYENIRDFTQTNTCTSPVGPGGSCVVTVTFAPTKADSISGILEVFDSEAGTEQLNISLSGNGLDAPITDLSPNTARFGNHGVATPQ